MRNKPVGYCVAVLMVTAGLLGSLSRGADTPSQRPLMGVTKPSDERTISFVRPGKIIELTVKEGDEVKRGQVVAKQDDREEQAKYAEDKLNADDETEVKVEIAVEKQDELSLARIKDHGGSPSEVDDADQKVVVDKARIDLAKVKKNAATINVGGSQAVLDKMTVKIPDDIDGTVQELFLKKGEVADAGSMKLMRVVQLDPLRVEIQVPILQAKGMKVGDSAIVIFSDKSERKDAKVTYKAAAGNSATETLLVRVEMPNPEKQPSGENVQVKFSGPAGVAAKE